MAVEDETVVMEDLTKGKNVAGKEEGFKHRAVQVMPNEIAVEKLSRPVF